MLRADHSLFVDEHVHGHRKRQRRRLLQVIVNRLTAGVAYRKCRAESRQKVGQQLRGQIVETRPQSLEAAGAVILLDGAQDLNAVLAVGSAAEKKRQQDHFAAILAEQDLANRTSDYKFRSGPGNGGRNRATGQTRHDEQSASRHEAFFFFIGTGSFNNCSMVSRTFFSWF